MIGLLPGLKIKLPLVNTIQERLLRGKDTELEKAMRITKTAVVTKLQILQLQEQSTSLGVIKNVAKQKTSFEKKTGRKAVISAGDATKFMKVENALHMVEVLQM